MEDLKSLKKTVRLLSILIILLIIAFVGYVIHDTVLDEYGNVGIIRTSGIVIEDEFGNERILIGAPVPYAKNRVRTDSLKVWNHWGQYYEPEFMEWYEDYNNDNYGILILDSAGFDRIALGNHVPDLSFGQRIGPLTGLIINDENGTERTGYGVLNINGENRVNLGLDDRYGIDRVSLSVDESGVYGLKVFDKNSRIFMGKTDSINPFLTDRPNFNGLIIDDPDSKEIDLVIEKAKE